MITSDVPPTNGRKLGGPGKGTSSGSGEGMVGSLQLSESSEGTCQQTVSRVVGNQSAELFCLRDNGLVAQINKHVCYTLREI